MNSDEIPSRQRRGSSPPFQGAEQGVDERMHTNVKAEPQSINGVRSRQVRDDETRWQDDGGESGEVV